MLLTGETAPGVVRPAFHCDQDTMPALRVAAGASSIARYSSGCPSGSRKYTAAAGIQPITLGSSAPSPKNDSGVTPARAAGRGRARTSSSESKATWSDIPIGAEPSDHRPSIAPPGAPIQRKAAPRSGRLSASGSPTTSR